jgi:tetratricopeptide (TPR) repeat protein
MRSESPSDSDLMVLDATYWLGREEDYDKARALAAAATKADERNAEAWFLLGLDRDLAGDAANAKLHYRKAMELAPDSPQYRNNLARVLLDGGELDAAIAEYRNISQFPLARLEQGLGHWAKGDFANALGAQRDALKMLDDSQLMEEGYYNRRAWMFRLAEHGVRLASLDDKRCYAQIEAAASRRLGEDSAAEFPPGACNEPPVEISQLVADDLCRFVDGAQPGFAEIAARLRVALKQPAACPAPPAPQDRPSAKVSQLQENMTWSVN